MILDLHRQGLSVSAIARQVSLDRKTVRTYIAKGRASGSLGCPATERLRGSNLAACARSPARSLGAIQIDAR